MIIKLNSEKSHSQQIYDDVVGGISSGKYSENSYLPPAGSLARDLKIPKREVLSAYSKLQEHGYGEWKDDGLLLVNPKESGAKAIRNAVQYARKCNLTDAEISNAFEKTLNGGVV